MIKFRVINADPLGDYREAAMITKGLVPGEYPQKKFGSEQEKAAVECWVRQIVANHSVLRSVRFRMTGRAPKSVVMQLIRATKGHPQPEVQSSRPDWTGKERSNDPYEEILFIQDHTAESFVEMAKQRLCQRTEAKTRQFMLKAVDELRRSSDPFLVAVGLCSQPACVWHGACPEYRPCSSVTKRLSDIILSLPEIVHNPA